MTWTKEGSARGGRIANARRTPMQRAEIAEKASKEAARIRRIAALEAQLAEQTAWRAQVEALATSLAAKPITKRGLRPPPLPRRGIFRRIVLS